MAYNFDKIVDRASSYSVKYDLLEEKFGRKDLIPLWVADMDFETPDFILQGIKKRLEHPVLGYSLKPNAYFDAITKWTKNRYQWIIPKQSIMSSGGVVPALAIAMLALSEPGDKIIIQPPVYFPFFDTILENDRQLVENPLKVENGNYLMDFEDLKSKIDKDTKILMFCNPHNPVGRVWKKSELLELSKICLENNVMIISDEIHADLLFPGEKHTPIASLSPEISQVTITTIAPSKTFNVAGLVSSVVITENHEFKKKFLKRQADLHLFVDNVLGTAGLTAAYEFGEQWLEELLAYIYDNYLFVNEYINENMPKIVVNEPEGTYLLWLDFRALDFSDEELLHFLVDKAHLALNPGIWFGKQGSGFARMNIASPKAILKKALAQLKEAYDSLN